MDVNTALTLCMAKKHLPHLIPEQVLTDMESQFEDAKQIMSNNPLLSNWFHKVDVVQWGETLSKPEIDPAVFTVVRESLLKEKKFWASYYSKSAEVKKKILINPLGLVYRSNMPYLVCSLWNSKDIFHLAGHRIKDANMTDQPAHIHQNFNLEAYISQGAFEYHLENSEEITLRAIVSKNAADYFLERSSENIKIHKKDDHSCHIEVSIKDSLDLRNTLRGFGNELDIIEPLYLRNEIHKKELHDKLTGLLNRGEFEIRLEDEVKRFERNQQPFSLLLLDIDDFKKVNDAHGHQDGDAVLKNLAKRLEQVVRSVDSVFRYGGEEFAVLLPETHKKKALEVAERIRMNVCTTPFSLPTSLIKKNITISIGLATFPGDRDKMTSLIKLADENLYKAKEKGRNCVVHCEDELSTDDTNATGI